MEVIQGGFYQVLDEKAIKEVHETSMKIIEEVGFEIAHPPLLDLLKGKGAYIKGQRAYLPRKLISQCIKNAPGEFTLYGLEQGREIKVGADRVYFGTGGQALYVMDPDCKERRPGTLQDVINFARLADRMDNLSFFVIPLCAQDININELDVNAFYQALKHTGKPVIGGVFLQEGLEQVIQLASTLAGGLKNLQERPFVGFITATTSPLKMDYDRAEILMEVARNRLPLAVTTAPVAGASAPITLAGSVALQNVEALMGVILTQMVNPGSPVLYSAVPCSMDMRTGSLVTGSIESGLINAALTQMARYYRLPNYLGSGGTNSKIPDAQAAYESANNCMVAGFSGGNFIQQSFGLLDGVLTISYDQFVIDNDIVGSCLRTLRGIEVTPDTLAFDIIKNVGPGGNFLTQRHTARHVRGEHFYPWVSTKEDYSSWVRGGSRSTREVSSETVINILNSNGKKYVEGEREGEILSLFPQIVRGVPIA